MYSPTGRGNAFGRRSRAGASGRKDSSRPHHRDGRRYIRVGCWLYWLLYGERVGKAAASAAYEPAA